MRKDNSMIIDHLNDNLNILLMDYADKNINKILSLVIFSLMIFPAINRKVKLFKKSQEIINIYKDKNIIGK